VTTPGPQTIEPRDLTLSGSAAEWLEPDGLGGYAMGTVAGPATRRYHGLLCVATTPPTGRVMLVNATAERVVHARGEEPLDAHHYPGVVFPDGNTRLVSFTAEPWPTWRYAILGGHVVRELVVVRGRALTLLRWTFVPNAGAAPSPRNLRVTPLVSGRDAHALHHENMALDPRCAISAGSVEIAPYPGAIPGVRISHNGELRVAPDWYRRFQYPLEAERGLDSEEDLFAYGELRFDLLRAPAVLALQPTGGAPLDERQLAALFDDERARRGRPMLPGVQEPSPRAHRLARAAGAFLVGGARGTTVIAGYPWFTDWGRDTFISARGLGLAFGPTVERELLLAWEPFVDRGMIPNRFPEAEGAAYNAVDASLWYALRSARHLLAPPLHDDDVAQRERLTSAVRRVLEGYLAGTRHGIHVDDDGLVHASERGLQLTWMDAKVGDWVVTPRSGKPVEIQALWVAALEAAARLFSPLDAHLSSELSERAAWARSSFAVRFWCEARGHLYDVIDGAHRDETLRPNQLYALGLCRPLVEPDRARRALAAVEAELLVPVGLRSRGRDAGYRGRMVGPPAERDAAYHEGTVWPFLLGIYADACQRVRGAVPGGILDGLTAHLDGPGLGQLAEVFDGDAPHHPRGCPAQAWSVAEALRIELGAVAED
jgi:predicted glycogen debranching enzyme